MFASATVNGANVTDPDAFGRHADRARVDFVRPSMSSVTGTLVTAAGAAIDDEHGHGHAVLAGERLPREIGAGDRHVRRVRDWPPGRAINVAPSGKWILPACAQPVFWKSLMSTASRRGSADRPRRLCARRRAGA